jgi:hypothetical protein
LLAIFATSISAARNRRDGLAFRRSALAAWKVGACPFPKKETRGPQQPRSSQQPPQRSLSQTRRTISSQLRHRRQLQQSPQRLQSLQVPSTAKSHLSQKMQSQWSLQR